MRKLGIERSRQVQSESVSSWLSSQDVRMDDVGCSRELDDEQCSLVITYISTVYRTGLHEPLLASNHDQARYIQASFLFHDDEDE
jgi:hypothetical protein